MIGRERRRTVDPVLSLSVPRDRGSDLGPPSGKNGVGRIDSISSVCFVPSASRSYPTLVSPDGDGFSSDSSIDSDSSEDESHLRPFQCRALARSATGSLSAYQSSVALELTGRFLISAHRNGSTLLWDLGQQRQQSSAVFMNRGPVTMLRRIDETARQSQALMFQTRDDKGTVSLHDAQQLQFTTINTCETYSKTFCAACPCNNHSNLVALPDRQDSVAVVRDWRLPCTAKPVVVLHNSTEENNNGMLMSLGFSNSSRQSLGRPILACGMESGKVLWYDLAMASKPLETSHFTSTIDDLSSPSCSLTLGRDPVLALDVMPSKMATSSCDGDKPATDGVVAIAGLAAHRDDLTLTADVNKGTVALLKATRSIDSIGDALQARVRVRRPTCHTDDIESVGAGKPGVGLCRFRPDGRIFAVGGWDRRLRSYECSAISHFARTH
jgi:WD40 repeat protein